MVMPVTVVILNARMQISFFMFSLADGTVAKFLKKQLIGLIDLMDFGSCDGVIKRD